MSINADLRLLPFAFPAQGGREDAAVSVRVWASSPIPVRRARSITGVCRDRRGSTLWRKRGGKIKSHCFAQQFLTDRAFYKQWGTAGLPQGRQKPPAIAPQDTGLNWHLPAESERDVGGSSRG